MDDTDDRLVVEVPEFRWDTGLCWILSTMATAVLRFMTFISIYLPILPVRFRLLDDLENNEYWYVDNVNIQYSTMANVRDQFATAAYTNNNGSQTWSANWTETGDDGTAGAGSIRVNGGYLELRDSGTEAGDTIYRSRNLSACHLGAVEFPDPGDHHGSRRRDRGGSIPGWRYDLVST